MQNKNDITMTYTVDVTVISRADEPDRCSDEEVERGFMQPDYAAYLVEQLKTVLEADDVTLRDLKLFIHDGNSRKEITP